MSIVKDVLELARSVLSVTEDVKGTREDVKELQREMKELALAVLQLKNEIHNLDEREQHGREKTMLKLENAFHRLSSSVPMNRLTAGSRDSIVGPNED